jgi:hypothetical protein
VHEKILTHMMPLADEVHPLSFRKTVWLWTKLGRYTGFRSQDFATFKEISNTGLCETNWHTIGQSIHADGFYQVR